MAAGGLVQAYRVWTVRRNGITRGAVVIGGRLCVCRCVCVSASVGTRSMCTCTVRVDGPMGWVGDVSDGCRVISDVVKAFVMHEACRRCVAYTAAKALKNRLESRVSIHPSPLLLSGATRRPVKHRPSSRIVPPQNPAAHPGPPADNSHQDSTLEHRQTPTTSLAYVSYSPN